MSRKIIGIDLGDRNSQYCVLNEAGTMLEEGSVSTTPAGFAKHFRALPPALIAVEVSVHSRWQTACCASVGMK